MFKRTFIALPIPVSENLKNQILQIQKTLKGMNVKWVETYNLHLTLAFLGDTGIDKIEMVQSKLSEIIVGYHEFTIKLTKMGAFKSLSHPQVLWIGIDAENELSNIYSAIQDLAGNLGFEKDTRPYKPHLTIGRVKSISAVNNLKEVMSTLRTNIEETILADKVIYLESILSSAGPVYKPIQTYKLAKV